MKDRTNPGSKPTALVTEASPKAVQTNPRSAARPQVLDTSSTNDQTNPSAEAKAGRSKRSAHDQTNPTQVGATERSAGHDGAGPKTAAKPRTTRRPPDDRTNPSPAAKRGVPERRAKTSQTNRSPAAERAAVRRSTKKEQTNPTRLADSAAARRPGKDDRTNPRAATKVAAAPARLHYDDAYIRGILQRVKTIAAVGMSANDMRPSYFAMLYLQQKGYRMIPVNPRYAGEEILGETVVASLDDLQAPPDMVQIFRRAEEAPAVVDEAIRAGAKVVWLQLGIRSDEAAARARAAGLDVVMDRCPKIEYGRLFGEIGWAGVNRRVISAKKGQAMQLSHKKGGLARRPPPRP